MKIVNYLPTLKAMAKQGLIELDSDTGQTVKHWTGKKIKAYYVKCGPFTFEYKGKNYGTRYFDGCLNPFVVLLDEKGVISFV
jgi:hypothetical protein